MQQTLQALAEPNRFRIVELLRAGPCPVGDIGKRLHLRQPQVSKHLRVLKEAGLVDVESQAQQRVYGLRGEPLQQLHAWAEGYRALWDERFQLMDAVLEDLKRNEKKAHLKQRTTHGKPAAKRTGQ